MSEAELETIAAREPDMLKAEGLVVASPGRGLFVVDKVDDDEDPS